MTHALVKCGYWYSSIPGASLSEFTSSSFASPNMELEFSGLKVILVPNSDSRYWHCST